MDWYAEYVWPRVAIIRQSFRPKLEIAQGSVTRVCTGYGKVGMVWTGARLRPNFVSAIVFVTLLMSFHLKRGTLV